MANEIFNESHYFMCEGGLKPASLKTSQENVLLENNKYYLTEYSLKCKGIDFSCRWVALLVAIIAAAIALLMSCPAGWVLLAAIAGAAGGALLAGKICGDKAAIVRVWLVIKDDVVFGEHKAVSNHKPQHLNCRAFGYNIVYKPNVTSEFEAICIFGGNVLMTGLEAFMYVYAFRGGGTLLTKPMTFFRNFGVNYLKTISKYGMLGRGIFGAWGGANAYYMSDTEGFNANEVAKASAQSFFFAETAAYHAVTERDPQSIALLLSMGGIPAGGKTGQRNSLGMEKVADATKADLANSVEGVKNNMRSAVHKAIEFRDKLRAQKKGDGAFEKSAEQIKAEELIDQAKIAEAELTDLLIKLAEENEGKMEGLDFRLKSVESLTRKLQTDGLNAEMKDVLRYTTIFENSKLTSRTKTMLDALKQNGYKEVAIKNTFKDGAIYKGINTNFETPNGQVFELQFHTPESFNVKQNINHILYEEARLPSTEVARQIELKNIMIENSSKIPNPQGVSSIK
ncbi:hypothetical protein ETU10_11080 [Apibacter muscae]|uniref:hypothetical protein n=1 Tax=Apibacter muscae TaxID=2509004 RepID=UPI0011ACA36B|nr:hypothetical protein [Apibacter muscae]TWP22482.1 hypothetical protein ETU10_11080 [Apibacter muscae]